MWLGVLLTAVAVGLGLAFYPYPPLPAAEVDAARSALQTARRDAGQLAPDLLDQAAAAAMRMEQLFARDRSRWFRFRRMEELDRAIGDTRSLAAEAVEAAAEVRTDRLRHGSERHRRLQSELALLTRDVEFLPPRETGARRAYARAGLSLAQAADAKRDGDFDRLDASLGAAEVQIEETRKALGERYERFNSAEWRRRWQSWTDATVAASRGGKTAIVVSKLDRQLYLLRDGRVAATFEADFGRNALASKVSAGDGATPEGRYHVTEKRANGATRWYKALMINYPNAEDMRAFQALRRSGRVPAGRGPGGLIEIHGQGGKQSNWTDGCVALQNSAMDRLYAQVAVGTPVTIVGVARLPGGDAPRTRAE